VNLKQVCFGSTTPEPKQVAFTMAVFACIGLCLHGLWVTFVPAPLLSGASGAAIFLAGALALHVALLWMAARRGRLIQLRALGRRNYLLYLLLTPAVLALVGWAIFAKSLPWAFTRVLGSAYASVSLMQLHHSGSNKLCRHHLRGAIMRGTFPGVICVRERIYLQYPERTVRVRLAGRTTPLGSTVSGAEVLGVANDIEIERVSE
jgi:hypothetical protein